MRRPYGSRSVAIRFWRPPISRLPPFADSQHFAAAVAPPEWVSRSNPFNFERLLRERAFEDASSRAASLQIQRPPAPDPRLAQALSLRQKLLAPAPPHSLSHKPFVQLPAPGPSNCGRAAAFPTENDDAEQPLTPLEALESEVQLSDDATAKFGLSSSGSGSSSECSVASVPRQCSACSDESNRDAESSRDSLLDEELDSRHQQLAWVLRYYQHRVHELELQVNELRIHAGSQGSAEYERDSAQFARQDTGNESGVDGHDDTDDRGIEEGEEEERVIRQTSVYTRKRFRDNTSSGMTIQLQLARIARLERESELLRAQLKDYHAKLTEAAHLFDTVSDMESERNGLAQSFLSMARDAARVAAENRGLRTRLNTAIRANANLAQLALRLRARRKAFKLRFVRFCETLAEAVSDDNCADSDVKHMLGRLRTGSEQHPSNSESNARPALSF